MDHRAQVRRRVQQIADQRGSVMPLVLGMVVCLLLLCAGITAGTSAFLARQRLQSACDGAAAAAADVGQTGDAQAATAAASAYLAVRNPHVAVRADTSAGTVDLACTATSEITLGALFATPTLTQTVRAVGAAVM